MTQLTQQASATMLLQQQLPSAVPTISVPGANIPGSGWFPVPMERAFGFVYQNAAPAGSVFDVIPAVANGFIYVKLVIMAFSVATEVRLLFGAVTYFDYDVKANQDYVLDFGVPGLTNASNNTAFRVSNPFAISNIRINAWGSYSNA
jgi:hypothetical protein